MTDPIQPRLDYIDVRTAKMALELHEKDVPETLELIAVEPTTLAQTRQSILESDYEACALFYYAIGFPLQKVREAFSSAAQAHRRACELRGTEPRMPAYRVTYDPDVSPDDPNAFFKCEPFFEDDETDYSFTNSRSTYMAVCEALIAGENSLAGKIAAMIWDPPNASYIGPNCFCTPNKQHLAYAFRDLFRSDIAASKHELAKVTADRRKTGAFYETHMVRALAERDESMFIAGLSSLLDWHMEQARMKENQRNPDYFLCVPGLGLSVMAILAKTCTVDDLPQDNVFLPIDLIRLALSEHSSTA